MADNDILDEVANAVNPSPLNNISTTVGDNINTSKPNLTDNVNVPKKGTQDWGKDLYSFENKSDYCNDCGNDMGVEIDGFLFFPEEVTGGNTYSHREYNRTKIMSGGEFVTRGQYTAREFNFRSTLTLDPNEPYMYDRVFQIMENKPCEIVSPQMGDNFKAEVQITKTHPKSSPSSLVLDINIKEIVEPKSSLVGDALLEYPSTTSLSDKAVEVTLVPETEITHKSKDEIEREQISYGWKVKDKTGREIENIYD